MKSPTSTGLQLMFINPNTKIAALLKQHPGALDAIVSLSPKFEKLRNPVLRKMMAGRASIAMASKAGGVRIEDFYNKLKPLGFKIDEGNFEKKANEQTVTNKTDAPDWDELINKFSAKLATIDVRELEMPGPMMKILDALDNLPEDHALFVYHKRIPLFLLPELAERKLEYRVKQISDNAVHLLIFKP